MKKITLLFIVAITLINCVNNTPQRPSEVYEALDSVAFGADKVYLLSKISKNDKNYEIKSGNSTYAIPYLYIVGKDTIDISDIKLEKEGDDALNVTIFQGNEGIYKYYFKEKGKYLWYLMRNERDCLFVNSPINLLNTQKKQEIIDFINENDVLSSKKEVMVHLGKINDKEEAKLTIINHLGEPIATNMFVIWTDIFIMEFQANDTIRNMTCTMPPIPPVDLEQYDTILAPNAKIETTASLSVMRQCEELFKITDSNIKVRAAIDFKYVNRKGEFKQRSNWIAYKSKTN